MDDKVQPSVSRVKMLDTRLFKKNGLIQTLGGRKCFGHMKCTQAAEC